MVPGVWALLVALNAGALDVSPGGEFPPESPPPPPRSVYELHLAVDIPVTLLGGSVGLARLIWRDDLARVSCPCDPSRLNAIDRGTVGNHSGAAAIAGDVTVLTVLTALPLADLLDVGASRALAEDVAVYLEILAVDEIIRNTVTFAVARPRPRTYAGDPKYLTSGEGYLSFYAGHVSGAFAALSGAAFTVGRRHDARVWPWIVAVIVGGSVAVDRVASGDHFPTDVAVGALAGTLEGVTIPWLHARKGEAVPLTITPGPGGAGLSLVGAF